MINTSNFFKANDDSKHLFFADAIAKEHRGTCIKFQDMYAEKALSVYVKDVQAHDANFAFLSTELSKLVPTLFEPKWNTTWQRDIPTDVGGGFVDYATYFSVEWSGMMNEFANTMGNAANYIPRVNAGLDQHSVRVFTQEIAYDYRFVDVEKMNTIKMKKDLDRIYKDIINAGWAKFCEQIGYLGIKGGYGLFNSPNVLVTTIDNSTATGKGFAGMTDEEILSFFNGMIEFYLDGTDMNLSLLPDTIRVPSFVGRELSNRASALYDKSLRDYLVKHNLAVDESSGQATLTIESRPVLNTLGVGGHGRIVAYKKDEDFVRMEIPYPMQHYITLPNPERFGYTSAFVGQISEIMLPYNQSAEEMGVVSYWDFIQ